jgi:hypothetical protein
MRRCDFTQKSCNYDLSPESSPHWGAKDYSLLKRGIALCQKTLGMVFDALDRKTRQGER